MDTNKIMKKKLFAVAAVASLTILAAGCGSGTANAAQPPSASSAFSAEETGGGVSEELKQESQGETAEVIPGSYTVPDGWVLSEQYSTDTELFYIEKGHEEDEYPDNISISVGTNQYSAEEHEQFRDAIVNQLLMQLGGVKADLTGDGTYTENGDLLYIFRIDEDESDVVTTQYYIVKDYGFCLIHLTNFSGSESAEEAAAAMANSFEWDA